MIRHRTIEITLKSALSAASGYSYSGSIDSDVCCTDCGLPYIPARRLKGCFRETWEIVKELYDTKKTYGEKAYTLTELLFGRRKDSVRSGFVLENAQLKNAPLLEAEISSVLGDSGWRSYVNPDTILQQYTTVIAQTKMTDGVADDNSLRYTRVVNETDPLKPGQPLRFYAGITFEDTEDGAVGAALEDILKGTRNIGYRRNRGLGSVVCRFAEDAEEGNTESTATGIGAADMPFRTESAAAGADDPVVISYALRNTEPLMLGSINNNTSLDYISGRSMLGLLAAGYLGEEGHSAEDPAFREVFLEGETIFSNLYPGRVEGKDILRYIPAPSFINKLKKTKKIVNIEKYKSGMFRNKADDPEYNPADGNQFRKLSGQYIRINDRHEVDLLDVSQRIEYHHRGENNADGMDPLLYYHQVTEEGQTFAGFIVTKKKYEKELTGLLAKMNLQVGKSRTAQYGALELAAGYSEAAGDRSAAGSGNTRQLPAGSVVLVSLDSDGIFHNERDYTVTYQDVYRTIAEQLGFAFEPYRVEAGVQAEKDLTVYSSVSVKTVHGYQASWNLHKLTYPAICAGSTFVYRLTADAAVPVHTFVGDRNLEGYGEVSVYGFDDFDYKVEEEKTRQEETEHRDSSAADDLIRTVLQKRSLEACRLAILDAGDITLSASLTGRVTLMLVESHEISDPEKAFDDFWKRIDSIKTVKEKEKIERYVLGHFGEKAGERVRLSAGTIRKKLAGPDAKKLEELYQDRFGETGTLDAYLEDHWYDLMLTCLVNAKYQTKDRD